MPHTTIDFNGSRFDLIFDLIYDKRKEGPLNYLQIMQDKNNFSGLLQGPKKIFYDYLPECRKHLIRDYRNFSGELTPQGYILPRTDNPELQDPFACGFEREFPSLINLTGYLKPELEGHKHILIIDDVCNTGRTIVDEILKLPQGIHVTAICPLRVIPQSPEQIAEETAEQYAMSQFLSDKLRSVNPSIKNLII